MDDDLLGRGGLTSRGAAKQQGRLLVELWRSRGGLDLLFQQLAVDDGAVEGVGGVVGRVGSVAAIPWLLLDHGLLHRLGDVEGRLVDGDGPIRLLDVLGGRGRGQADHFVVVVVVPLELDLDLLVQLPLADVFEAIFFLLLPASGAEA